MEKIFETQEEVTGFVTESKGGYVCTVDGLPTFMPSSQIDVRPLKKVDHLMNVPIKVVATRIDKKEEMSVQVEEQFWKKVKMQN